MNSTVASGQDLTPRAYLITPKGSNAVILSYSWNNGSVEFGPAVPVEDVRGRFHTQVLSYYRSHSLLGRSSNLVVSLPYAVANFQGQVAGDDKQVYRSGLADARVRFAVNLRGGPAMGLKEFLDWREKGLLGVSLTAIVPIGQYDPARIMNIGTKRWAFKPEVGLTRRLRHWVVEGYAGVWLFAPNPEFFPGSARRTQGPMGAVESHVGYYVKRGLWVSFDCNFWTGGRSSVDDIPKEDRQKSSRIGTTISIPINRHQSFKFSYSQGAYVRTGGDYQTVSAAWQYSWLDRPN